MEIPITLSTIAIVIGLFGTVFGVYHYFRNPTEDLEKKQIGTEKDIANKATILAQKEVENKTTLLAQQVEWEKQANEKRFTEFNVRLTESINLAQNHIHTVDVKVDKLIEQINLQNVCIGKLTTIIDERIPKKIT